MGQHTDLRGHCVTIISLWILGLLSSVNAVAQVKSTSPAILEGSKDQGSIGVLDHRGKFLKMVDSKATISLADPLSPLVERFLRTALRDYEEFVNPPRYTTASEITPIRDGVEVPIQDGFGLMEKGDQPRAIPFDSLPAAVKRFLVDPVEEKSPQ
jgi:hypothetical protein